MSITEDLSPPSTEISTPPTESAQRKLSAKALYPLAMRLHFYAGIFVAPFILIAAVTGALYAISPTLERIVSHDLLYVDGSGPEKPLSEQVSAAVRERPDLPLVAVAPAPEAGQTTRVIFGDTTLGDGERRAVFVNPYTAQPVGESVVYGSSGALPLRTWIDHLHRDLHLGEPGRIYSELAASWLWIIALAGLVLWWRRVRGRRNRNSAKWLLVPDRSQGGRGKSLNWHGAVGIWVLPLLLIISVTGMTWSTYAGDNIAELRKQLSWTTPSVSTKLPGSQGAVAHSGGEHAEHGAAPATAPADPAARIAQLTTVYAVARANGVTQPVEISVPAKADQAFAVKERRMPGTYTVDAIAVNGLTGVVTDRLPYAQWSLMAKLTNWGIQFHMGLMFGLANQLLLLAAMIGLLVVIVLGYRMWWQRRPMRTGARIALGRAPRRGAIRQSAWWLMLPLVAAALVVGWFVPLVGLSLLGFVAVDVVIGIAGRLRSA
ncbi:PepSY-associated TM helix domain-containing protein [Nocardia sp. JCM 34519.1]|uniref:PepSY-associated TM helix domain-containing protein n=1 Tax=unclassified Nocardia TaxID=2637762 RepID=UPI0035A84FB4